MGFYHIPVLLPQAMEALSVQCDGVYVDCTAGGGSHSAAIHEKLTTGKLICIDRDPYAIAHLNEKFSAYIPEKVEIFHVTYDNIGAILGERKAKGVLADLGVSSVQLDTAERGFSFHNDAPLDMRMGQEGKTAADVVNAYSEADLSGIIFNYGDEKFARSIAKNIVKSRTEKPIETTFELVDIIKKSMPAKAMRDGHPARRTFQAIRIEVNDEIRILENSVEAMFEGLEIGGTLSIITFHSLEDRVVKNIFRELCMGCTCPKEFPVCVCNKTPRGKIKHKPITASEEELKQNPRARSAKLRSIIRLK